MSRSSRFELGLSLNYSGLGVGDGWNEWGPTIVTVDFDPGDISVGFDSHDLGLDIDFLSQ